jgi:putative ABC transport system ATP-binding protein
MSILSLDNVSYTYKSAKAAAISDISCTFELGRLYAIVGPSGSGKSTLLSLLAGLDLCSDGEIALDGVRLSELDLDAYRRESIAMIFQNFQLLPLLKVIENVCYPLELCGVKPSDAKTRAAELLESVGISREQMRRFPSKLSGGEQQRVAIARALASGARIILADEPTGNLDTDNTEKIMEILRNLADEEGICVIVVTHDTEVANKADTVYKMTDGKLKV